MTAMRHDILLIGGGHAHVAVLSDWIMRGLPAKRAALITPNRYLRYSGMVPDWIAGRYGEGDGLVDVAALARRAGAQLVIGACAEIDPQARHIRTEAGEQIAFEIASIDTGGVGRARHVLGPGENLIDIRPIDAFVERLSQMTAAGKAEANIAVVGGGAAGAEIAFAMRNMGQNRMGGGVRADVTLITGRRGLLPDFAPHTRRLVADEMQRQGIAIITRDAVFKAGAMQICGSRLGDAGTGADLGADLVVAALGSGAARWPRAGGLECDEDGFIAVDAQQRSLSHGAIFAVGDAAMRQDMAVPHSGVHAVRAGPVLAQNLRDVLAGKEPRKTYRPRAMSLYLIASGDGRAIASYGPFAAKGAWAGRLKHWIDTGWIAKYADLADEGG